MRRLVLGAATAAAVALAGASGSGGGMSLVAAPDSSGGGLLKLAAPQTALHMTQSNNWSGYNQGALEKGKTFSSISGTWTVPTATQHRAGEAESSATWVGIGGGCLQTSCATTDNTLIQAGTGQDVAAGGRKTYYAWYELIPAPSVTVALPVAPGNKITVNINQTAPGLWNIEIRNVSTGRNWSTTVPYTSTMGSAEWIEETPLLIGTGGTGISAMPKLSTVRFSNARVNGAPAGLTSAERMQLVSSNGSVLATPSNPGPARAGFNDCTYATSCPAP